tara:strand:- start:313 stop:1107 length:795 start_codon:yes stop_codon:yes gene_type:complete
MINKIYIPTLGRSHNQITFDNMTPSVKQITRLVVQPKEQHLYSNYPIIVLPENDIGITATRKFIWHYAKGQRYFVMDDDVKMACRKPWHNGDKTKRIMTQKDWDICLSTTNTWMDDGISWGGFRTGGLPPTTKEYIDNSGTAEVFFFDGNQLPNVDDLDWELSTAEDISLSLQLLSKGYRNRVWDRFVYLSDFVGTEGGCLDMGRNLKMINDNHAKLIKKFPDYVSYNGEKEMMGGIFNKIKVQYKKAYLDSQKSKSSLETFMN